MSYKYSFEENDKELREIFDLDNYVHTEAVEGVDYFPEEGATYQSLGGKVSNEIRKQNGIGVYDIEWQKKHNPVYSKEWQKKNNPFYDPEWQKNRNHARVNNFTPECHRKGGLTATSIKYKCKDCDMISSIGGITTHIKYSKHIGYERLVNGNKTG